MDFNNFSSSSMFSSDDICLSTESETGLWKFRKISNDHDGNEVNRIAAPRESSLFSSSLPDLFSRKLQFSPNNALYGRSVDTNASHYEEDELVDSLQELEAQIIGNLLPDEDDLLSGVTDWNDHIVRDSTGDDIDGLDFFSSVGGLELEDVDNKNSKIIRRPQHNQLGHQKSPITTSFQGLHGISSSVPNTLPSVIKFKSVGIQCEFTESSSLGQLNFDTQAALAFHPHSLPERRHGFTNDVPLNPLEVAGSSSSFPLFGHHEKWSNSYPPPQTMWPNSPPTLQRFNQLPMSPSHMITNVLPTNNHHVQSPPLWDRRYNTYVGESVTPHSVDFVPSHNRLPHFGLNFHNQRGMMVNNSFDAYKHIRSHRNAGTPNLADLKGYELDIDRIMRGKDNRTTLMIKNIPNKYTSAKLLDTINERHKGTYDFFYLPIDFKNNCNVGYAFINMTSPSSIAPFYQAFNGKKWELFNSEKVASLTYARIQGKAALIAHFQNSSLMNMDELCRPALFNTDGDQVPFPIAMKPGRVRSKEDSVSKESD